MGCSIFKYRNIVRINNAKIKMLTSNSTIGEIADETGYESISYFSRIFKKYEGISPSEYQRRMLEIKEINV